MSAYTDMIGRDTMRSYMDTFGNDAINNDGEGDGGVDIILPLEDGTMMILQAKSSADEAEKFWATSILRKDFDNRFIRLLVGCPGTKAEVMEAVQNDGFWIGLDVADRENRIQRLRVLRDRLLG